MKHYILSNQVYNILNYYAKNNKNIQVDKLLKAIQKMKAYVF